MHSLMEDKIKNYENRIKELEEELQMQMNSLEKEKSKLNGKYDISHLTQTTQVVWGPIQDDEAIMLYGIVKALRPKTLIEFGFGHGVSSYNFLKALDADAKMFTYDIEILNKQAESFNDKRFKFILKSQTEFNPDDFENRTIDFAYLDNGHYFDKEKILFPKLIKQMSETGILVVHDTGLHVDDIVKTNPCTCDFKNLCGVLHCSPERQFVNWISENYPEWQIVNIHSFQVYRHGLTIIQRKYNLSIESTTQDKCRYAQ